MIYAIRQKLLRFPMTHDSASWPSGPIIGLYTGQVKTLWPGKAPSAIDKQAAPGPQTLGREGFEGDEQADRRVHGGPEKALHHYASEHMAFWRDMFPNHAEAFAPGCFGENISTTGFDEHNLCIGDVIRVGSAAMQVCQGRQPCWKLSAHLNLPTLASQFQLTGRTGWYYRVLQTGEVKVGDMMAVTERPHPELSIHLVTQARFAPRPDQALCLKLSELDTLAAVWRAHFKKKLR